MDCPNCKNPSDIPMVSEELPCSNCGGSVILSYYLCSLCKYTWRTCNNVVVDGIAVESARIDGLIDVLTLVIEELSCSDDQMSDTLHYCLSCQSLAYQVGDYSYLCPECGFEWDIV